MHDNRAAPGRSQELLIAPAGKFENKLNIYKQYGSINGPNLARCNIVVKAAIYSYWPSKHRDGSWHFTRSTKVEVDFQIRPRLPYYLII